jgi:KaiC/GvpD/RAD55 family RecA-like ATPase
MGMKVQPYNFDPTFERAVVALLCSRSRFFGRIGGSVEADALGGDAAKLAVQAAQAVAHDTGHGPESSVLVVQRLRRWMGEGRVALAQIEAVADLLDAAEDAGLPPEDAVVAEIVPILRRRTQQSAVEAALDEYTKRGDFSRVEEIISKAKRMGDIDVSLGTKLGAASFASIEALSRLVRLPFGIPELDAVTDGGLWRGAHCLIIGDTGAGKSMMLSHAACASLLSGLFVVYATLELPEALVLARIKANLTGVPINALMNGSMAVAKERLAALDGLGLFIVKHFSASTSTVEDLRDWVKVCEDEVAHKIDVLVVDYADKLTHKVTGKETNEYHAQRFIHDALRDYAEEHDHWSLTASQRRDIHGKKRADAGDAADSKHKGRIADMVITINVKGDEGDELLYNVAKNRMGRSSIAVGPMPHDFACGRMVPLSR